MRGMVVAGVLAVGLLGVQGAQAADMPDYPLRGGYSDFGARRPIWEGFYIGGQGAESWLNTKTPAGYNSDIEAGYVTRTGLGSFGSAFPSVQARKGAYGGFAGYNSQWEDVVVGVEANYLHSDIVATATALSAPTDPIVSQSNVSVALKDFGSLRLRGGYMMGSFLPYAFVGFAAGSADVSRSAGVTLNAGVPVTFPFQTANKTLFMYGYSAGVGLDVMLIGGLFARGEYEYAQYTNNLKVNVNTVRVGLGYRF